MGLHSVARNRPGIIMLRLLLSASLAVAISAMPAADPQFYYHTTTGYVQPQYVQPQYVQPQVQYVQQQPQMSYVQQPQVAVAAAEPKTVSYQPTTYVANAEPFFFGNMGGGGFNG